MKIDVSKQEFFEWLEAKGLARLSLKSYNTYFNKFNFNEIEPVQITQFLIKYKGSVPRAMVFNVLEFIKTHDYPSETKAYVMSIQLPKRTGRKKKRIPAVLTKTEVHMIARSMNSNRYKLMTYCNFYLGLRLSELINLRIDDFNWKEWQKHTGSSGIVKIIGKGDKQRNLPVSQPLMARLFNYAVALIEKQPDNIMMFPISERRWQMVLGKISKKVIDRWVNPHLLRHSVCTFLHEEGLDLQEIAEFLGHSSIATTQIYTHINKKELNKKVIGAFA